MPQGRTHHSMLAAGAFLEAEPNLAVESAVLEALPQIPAAEARPLLALLAARQRERGAIGLIRIYPKLGSEIRTLVLEWVGWLANSLRDALLSASDPELRDGALNVIVESRQTRFAPLLAELMCFGEEKDANAVQMAGDTLADGVQSATHSESEGKSDLKTVASWFDWDAHLESALRLAMDRWDCHHHRGLLTAGLSALLHAEATLFERAADRKSGLSVALNNRITGQEADGLSIYAVLALAHSHLRESALHRLEHAVEPLFWRPLFRSHWLLCDPRVAFECRRIKRLDFLDHFSAFETAITPAEMEGIGLFVQRTGLSAERKCKLYENWINHSDEVRARCGFWNLLDVDLPEVNHILRRRASAADDSIGRWASRELEHRERMAQLDNLRKGTSRKPSSDAPLADQSAVQAFWQAYDQSDVEDRLTAGMKLLKAGPALVAVLKERLSWPNPAHRAKALQIARDLGCIEALEESVRALLRDPDHHVRSAAVAALGEHGTDLPHHVIHMNLQDVDPRVQANTVEVLANQKGEGYQHLLEDKLDSPHARVRANAIAALLKISLPDAAEALMDMLESKAPSDRLSGLWVAGQLKFGALQDRLTHMANADPDPHARRRAAEIVQQRSWPMISSATPSSSTS